MFLKKKPKKIQKIQKIGEVSGEETVPGIHTLPQGKARRKNTGTLMCGEALLLSPARTKVAPLVPDVKSGTDTSNFDPYPDSTEGPPPVADDQQAPSNVALY